ncbi:MAG: benzoyl-CoA reductase subunit C [Pseudomonadota bacterium]|nr:benzoyl-CoA reductase subunit C [Pseudomonadota bacterium]
MTPEPSRRDGGSSRAEIVAWARGLYEDLDLGVVRAWLDAAPGRKACGYLPVYVPRELIHAAGMLPVGVHGGGNLEIIRGDAYYQSYICHLPRSVVELGLSGRLRCLSAMLFPSTCDVIRNLSGMWQLLEPGTYVHYVDLPQVNRPERAMGFWVEELRTILADLSRITGRVVTDAHLEASIALYDEMRGVVEALYTLRRMAPWKVPTEELYLLLRAGEVCPVEDWLPRARAYLRLAEADPAHARDNARVILVGAFCEQPPLGLIRTIERAGCYVVDDDLLIGNRLVLGPTGCPDGAPVDGMPDAGPLARLAHATLFRHRKTSVYYEPDAGGKRRLVPEQVAAAGADGVIFAAPSFCDPALLDRPMLRAGAEAAKLPCIAFEYAENTGQFQQYREQAGTFSDSIKLWIGTRDEAPDVARAGPHSPTAADGGSP